MGFDVVMATVAAVGFAVVVASVFGPTLWRRLANSAASEPVPERGVSPPSGYDPAPTLYARQLARAAHAGENARRWWALHHATGDRGAAAVALTWQDLARDLTIAAEKVMSHDEVLAACRWSTDSDELEVLQKSS